MPLSKVAEGKYAKTRHVEGKVTAIHYEAPSGLGRTAGHGKLGTNRGRSKGHGAHRYYFTLYAVDRPVLGVPAGAKRPDLDGALKGRVLAEVRYLGRYGPGAGVDPAASCGEESAPGTE